MDGGGHVEPGPSEEDDALGADEPPRSDDDRYAVGCPLARSETVDLDLIDVAYGRVRVFERFRELDMLHGGDSLRWLRLAHASVRGHPPANPVPDGLRIPARHQVRRPAATVRRAIVGAGGC